MISLRLLVVGFLLAALVRKLMPFFGLFQLLLVFKPGRGMSVPVVIDLKVIYEHPLHVRFVRIKIARVEILVFRD